MITVWLLCAVLGVSVLLHVMRTRSKDSSYHNEPPIYSRSLPIIGIGHLLLAKGTKLWTTFKMIFKDVSQQGGVVKMRIGPSVYYFITDPEDALTAANACLEKHYAYKFAKSWFGQSLVMEPVPKWKRHRKLLNPAFSLPVVHSFMNIFNSQAKQLVRDINDFVGNGPVRITSHIQANVFRTACLTVFGSKYLQDEETFKQYLFAIKEITQLLTQRFQIFWQHSDLLFNLFGPKRKHDQLISTMTNISDRILEQALEAMASEQTVNDFSTDYETSAESFMDVYLRINVNNALTPKELRDQIQVTIAGTFNTTDVQFENILYLLGSYPEVQEHVYREIIAVVGLEKDVDKEDLQKLVYTDAVLKEALRMLPVVPMIARTLDQDVKLKNCTLRGGSHAAISLYGINHHSSWGRDVDEFRPERWLEAVGVPNIPSAFASFSIGKRGCIGKTYALTSMKIYLVHIVRAYRIQADISKMEFTFEILLKPAHGDEISIHLRNTS